MRAFNCMKSSAGLDSAGVPVTHMARAVLCPRRFCWNSGNSDKGKGTGDQRLYFRLVNVNVATIVCSRYEKSRLFPLRTWSGRYFIQDVFIGMAATRDMA